jgi:hypothetical protein
MTDKVHNAKAILADHKKIGDDLWDRFQGGKDGASWYYASLVTTFTGRRKWPELMAELKSVVAELRGLVDSAGIS